MWNELIKAPVRRIHAAIECSDGTTQTSITDSDDLISFDVQRVADGEFFGVYTTHRINFKVRDKDRKYNFSAGDSILASVYFNETDYMWFPKMTISEVHRDEDTNELSITGYDKIYYAVNSFLSDITLDNSYSIQDLAEAIANYLGLTLNILNVKDDDTSFDIFYDEGANFEGTENLRDCLKWIAQATQTVCYMDSNDQLVFKRLSGDVKWTITRDDYDYLKNSGNRRLQTIAATTTLGDNVESSTTQSGSIQYIRDNPLLELRDDLASILDAAIAQVGNMTICEFDCTWRGNPAIEYGDKIALENKDGTYSYSYLLNDEITYDGGLNESTSWTFNIADNEFLNSTTIGQALNQTYARVDKANKQIEITVRDIAQNSQKISDLQLSQNQINASVEQVKKNTQDSIDGLTSDVATITNKVNATMTADQIDIAIKSEIAKGVSSVTTSTGFRFDEEGLTVKKSDSEMSTNINENGMVVSKNNRDMLVANADGVDAQNLHATTYLIIGNLSRFEDFNRKTACFWIGD